MEYPFDKTWWIAQDRLLGGRYPGTANPDDQEGMLAALLDVGINYLINLQEEHETGSDTKPFRDYMPIVRKLAEPRGIKVGFQRFPIRDQMAAPVDTLVSILDCIDTQMADGRNVYVHCWGGNGRTGTVAGCWLVRHGRTAEQAFAEMAAGRSGRHFRYPAPENDSQRALVTSWHKYDPRLSVESRDKTQ